VRGPHAQRWKTEGGNSLILPRQLQKTSPRLRGQLCREVGLERGEDGSLLGGGSDGLASTTHAGVYGARALVSLVVASEPAEAAGARQSKRTVTAASPRAALGKLWPPPL
jgi:hypothetical protein